VPIIGDIPIASALIFDIGVYAVVVGTTVLMLIAIAHQSIRSPRHKKPVEETKKIVGGEG
jgi:multicomponent K+:H+ antiporter subunit A